MNDDSHLYLDASALESRGWTRGLITQFLGEADRREPVDHWANSAGKRTYFLGRVQAVEATEAFGVAFESSIRRRKLDNSARANFLSERDKTAGAVERWELSLSPKDRLTQSVVAEASALIEHARKRGFRTPNRP